MVVLGIDPGVANTGFGVVSVDGPRMGAVDAGVITVPAGEPIETRLARIHEALTGLITRHQPVAMALEDVYFGRNVRSAIAVGQARGVALLTAAQDGVPCFDYTPQVVKMAVCGSGAAAKDQVQRMVGMLLGVPRAQVRSHRRRAGSRDLPRGTQRLDPRARRARSARCRSRDRLGTRRGPRASPRPRGHRVGRGRLPARGLDRDLEVRAGKRQGDHASRPSRGSRRLDGVIRVRQRGGARPLPAPHVRLGDRAEGGDRDPLRWSSARAPSGDRSGRREAIPGCARRRQANLRASDRRASREGRGRAQRGGRRGQPDRERRSAQPGQGRADAPGLHAE